MLVNNWYKSIAYTMTNGAISVTRRDGASVSRSEKGLDMTSTSNYNPRLKTFLKGGGYGGVEFGNGTTPPAMDDYNLSGEAFTTFTGTVNVTTDSTDEYCEITALYTLTNTGTVDFTISEVALFASQVGSNFVQNVLIDRTLLDSPVTIPAGGIGRVTYSIRVNYPT